MRTLTENWRWRWAQLQMVNSSQKWENVKDPGISCNSVGCLYIQFFLLILGVFISLKTP